MHKDRWKVIGVIALFVTCALILYLKPYSFRTLDMVIVFAEKPDAETVGAVFQDLNVPFTRLDMTDDEIRETAAAYNREVTRAREQAEREEQPQTRERLLAELNLIPMPTGVAGKTFSIRIPRLTPGERKVLLTALEREAGLIAYSAARTTWGVLNSGRGPFNLGLDLQGGVQFRLEAYRETAADGVEQEIAIGREELNGVIRVMRNRIDPTGVRELSIQIEGANWINIEIPGERNPERVRAQIRNPAHLEFISPGAVQYSDNIETGYLPEGTTVQLVNEIQDVAPVDERGNKIFQYRTDDIVIEGSNLATAFAGRDPETGRPEVQFRMTREGARRFGEFTSTHVDQFLAIVLDKQVISCPRIQSPIWGGSGRITGRFTDEEVQDLVTMLNAGRLPVPVRIVQEETVGPSLGRDSIRKSSQAAVIGLIAVLAFMLIAYRVMGGAANITLLYYMVVALGVLAMFDATLTLPGIAGLILSLGMAVDANIIIFERIREEAAAGKTIRNAIDLGFQRAFSAIVDANITTLIGTGVLYWLGTGPIRGFAVTLSIGIMASMFSAIIVTRMLLKRSTTIKILHNLNYYGLKKSDTQALPGLNKGLIRFDILRNRWKWFALSSIIIFGGALVSNLNAGAFALETWHLVTLIMLIVAAAGFYWVRRFARNRTIHDVGTFLGIVLVFGLVMINLLNPAGFNWGVDFTGGQRLDIKFDKEVTTDQVGDILTELGLTHNPVQLTAPNQALIRWRPDENGAFLVFHGPADTDAVSRTFSELGIGHGELLDLGQSRILVRDADISRRESEVEAAMADAVGPLGGLLEHTYSDGQFQLLTNRFEQRIGPFEIITRSEIGPSIGDELRKNAILALLLASIGILIYVGFRFRIVYGMAAIIAVLHDVAVVLALYSIFRWEINTTFVAVVLTIIGYSINDSIVIFDRIRENLGKYKRDDPIDVMNVSLWQTMRRSLFTSGTTTLAILAVAVLGGYTIRDFALAIMAGVLAGTYSSIMTATPILTFFAKYDSLSRTPAPAVKSQPRPATAAPATPAPAPEADRKPTSASDAAPADKQKPAAGPDKQKKDSQKKGKKGKQRRR